MRTVRRFLLRLLQVTGTRQAAERLQEEIESHISSQTEENIRTGMEREEAHRQARIQFGSVEAVRENGHAELGLPFAENLLLDLRYALRVLRKSPAFTTVAVVTLMLGIGANIVAFGVLNAVLLRPLHVANPQDLYQVRHEAWAKGRLLTTSYPAFEDFRRRNTTFSGMAGIYGYSSGSLRWHNTILSLSGDEVTGNYFDLLGVTPQLGRFFHATDEHGPNSAPYVVLSDSLWRRAFHADDGVIGRTVELNKHPFTIIGVSPAHFHGTEQFVWPDYWIPMVNEEQVEGWDYLHSRTSLAVTVIGRLKPGVTRNQATQNLNATAAGLAKEYPETDEGLALRLIHPGLYGDEGDVIRRFLWSVSGLALLVLAAACANLTTLSAARAADRSRELALRVALGSSRRRLVQQLLVEATAVSLTGGAVGLGIAAILLHLLNLWQSPFGRLAVSVDARVYLASVALTLGSALLSGMLPARLAWRTSPSQTIKGGAPAVPHLSRLALRDLLLGAQIAICTLLVTASLVAVRSMERELHAPLGFQPQGVMLAGIELTGGGSDLLLQNEHAIVEAAQSLPGVTDVGTVSRTPMTGGMHGVPVFPPGTTEFALKNSVLAPYVFSISPGYLQTAHTRLLNGRDVSWHDTARTPDVAVVNEMFTRKMWGETPALGRRFILNGKLTEVIGVAENGKYHDLHELPQPVAYVPASQSGESEAVLVVRSRLASKEMAAALDQMLSSIEPDVPRTIESWSDTLAGEWFPACAASAALGFMGLLAAMLAVTGIFGMAAYNVSQRRKELGIRVALGARKQQLLTAAVGRPMVLLGAGSVLGLLAGVFASGLIGRLVYQAEPGDPVVVGGAVVAMALFGMAATAIPARRALAIDPSKLMRED